MTRLRAFGLHSLWFPGLLFALRLRLQRLNNNVLMLPVLSIIILVASGGFLVVIKEITLLHFIFGNKFSIGGFDVCRVAK
jgi:hypothetical protein